MAVPCQPLGACQLTSASYCLDPVSLDTPRQSADIPVKRQSLFWMLTLFCPLWLSPTILFLTSNCTRFCPTPLEAVSLTFCPCTAPWCPRASLVRNHLTRTRTLLTKDGATYSPSWPMTEGMQGFQFQNRKVPHNRKLNSNWLNLKEKDKIL